MYMESRRPPPERWVSPFMVAAPETARASILRLQAKRRPDAAEAVTELVVDGRGYSYSTFRSLETLMPNLRAHPSLRKLTLANFACARAPATAAQLMTALSPGSQLLELTLTSTDLGAEGASYLAGSLMHNRCIRSLALCRCQLGSQGASTLTLGLRRNSSLTAFSLAEDPIGDAAAVALIQGIGQKRYASVSFTNIGMGGNAHFALLDAMALEEAWEEVRLRECGFTAAPLSSFVASPGFCTRLLVLDLSRNGLQSVGGRVLGEALLVSPVLRTLLLAENQLGDQGSACIFESLQMNRCLTELSVSSNQLEVGCNMVLAKLIQANAVLQHLNLSHNLDSGLDRRLFPLLAKNKSLVKLQLDSLLPCASCCVTLATALQSNSTLQSLSVRPASANSLDRAQAFRDLLLQNHSLTELQVVKETSSVPPELLPVLAEIKDLTERNREPPLVLCWAMDEDAQGAVQVKFHKMSGAVLQDEHGQEVVLSIPPRCSVKALRELIKANLEPKDRRVDIVMPDRQLLRHWAASGSFLSALKSRTGSKQSTASFVLAPRSDVGPEPSACSGCLSPGTDAPEEFWDAALIW